MARVLLVGESWFVHSIHQKGFDSFTTSTYEEGGAEFVAALRGGDHVVTHIPAHRVEHDFPRTAAGIADIADVVVLSDIGANTFQLPAEVFARCGVVEDPIAALREFVARGGALLMVGGYLSFSGIDAKARWAHTVLAETLPVGVLDRDDRIELPAGAAPRVCEPTHPIVAGLDREWPPVLGLNQVVAAPAGAVLATVDAHPLLVVGEWEAGRTAAFTSDLAPHWAPPAFLAWPGYAVLFDRIVRWLSREEIA
ncbi:glutamine amidotransferase [Microbacterium sp. SORGH_AS_0888]|uniref:glutamine amidotransferase n=1 Tax=Microbacterium sp. SORGH_AS_0888 TaxID=3041791 RepID=UPI0027D81240|nr:glutamine amidotransferase [Microbacterium sp. SORGH_AS_0888]